MNQTDEHEIEAAYRAFIAERGQRSIDQHAYITFRGGYVAAIAQKANEPQVDQPNPQHEDAVRGTLDRFVVGYERARDQQGGQS